MQQSESRPQGSQSTAVPFFARKAPGPVVAEPLTLGPGKEKTRKLGAAAPMPSR